MQSGQVFHFLFSPEISISRKMSVYVCEKIPPNSGDKKVSLNWEFQPHI